MKKKFHKAREKPLGLTELIAIAIGGMVGGGIFSILGISTEKIGNATPIAILIGGILAFFAAYSYVKLATYYNDEGATYSFFKRTFPKSHFAASVIGWFIVFGYISTLALYAFTFASYTTSMFHVTDFHLTRDLVAGGILLFFTIVNLLSVKGMGRLEDLIVYAKLIILLIISVLLAEKGSLENITPIFNGGFHLNTILTVAALTFVAYEGFQLVIHATNEMEKPKKNIPHAIYSAIGITTLIYLIIAIGALLAIPKANLIADKEYALAAGAGNIFGNIGIIAVVFGAMLATSSAINGTIFGASRLMAVIAEDGYFPKFLSLRIKKHIPKYAIIAMFFSALLFIIIGNLESILQFGSITFILVSVLMAIANFKIREKTKANPFIAIISILALLTAAILILYYEFTVNKLDVLLIIGIYAILTLSALVYAMIRARLSFLKKLHMKIKTK
jgi:amino acid transporter